MSAPLTIDIPGLLTAKTVKKVIFGASGLTIESPTTFAQPDFIAVDEITAFRYGVKWISGYKFVIGRHYFIELKNVTGNIHRIKLKSYYSIKRDAYFKLWSQLLQELWKNYFKGICITYYNLYKNHQTFE
ncbi:MAG TPA: hypothetical protein VFE53_22385, partial [Mucilaginibacter sp.]|nr:hypothetical protein [Mucilaginibacter sp.]